MHTQPMAESDGDLSEPKPTDAKCPKCQQTKVTYQTWESHCGGYEDYKYTCGNDECNHVWWVDGIDS